MPRRDCRSKESRIMIDSKQFIVSACPSRALFQPVLVLAPVRTCTVPALALCLSCTVHLSTFCCCVLPSLVRSHGSPCYWLGWRRPAGIATSKERTPIDSKQLARACDAHAVATLPMNAARDHRRCVCSHSRALPRGDQSRERPARMPSAMTGRRDVPERMPSTTTGREDL